MSQGGSARLQVVLELSHRVTADPTLDQACKVNTDDGHASGHLAKVDLAGNVLRSRGGGEEGGGGGGEEVRR